ncbi:MAG: hypothetical protein ACM3S1_08235 [Hyphomicrobiales bacterium]
MKPVAKSDLIVSAEVLDVDFAGPRSKGMGGSLVTIRVLDRIKGEAPDTLVIGQAATIEIDAEGQSATGLVLVRPSSRPRCSAGTGPSCSS